MGKRYVLICNGCGEQAQAPALTADDTRTPPGVPNGWVECKSPNWGESVHYCGDCFLQPLVVDGESPVPLKEDR